MLHLARLIGRQIAREAFNLSGQAGHPEEVSIEHIEAHQHENDTTGRFKDPPIDIQAMQILDPGNADGADSHRDGAPSREGEQEQRTDPG